MLSSLILRRAAPLARRGITTSAIKRSSDPLIGHVEQAGRPGANLPFDINNKTKLAVYFILFFGSAFSVPFIAVRLQLIKKNSS